MSCGQTGVTVVHSKQTKLLGHKNTNFGGTYQETHVEHVREYKGKWKSENTEIHKTKTYSGQVNKK